MMKPLVIGIAGGTGSGKTRFSKEIVNRVSEEFLICLSQDSYYKNLSHLTYEERCEINFDHPDSIDFESLHSDLKNLTKYCDTEVPIYNFKTHTREQKKQHLSAKDIIIIEGIFAFYCKKIRSVIDIKIFVDTPADIRILRRAKRDINKRGRSMESIVSQYLKSVRPMHNKFVEPTKKHADILVPNGGKNKVALDIINSQLLPLIEGKIKNANS